MSSPTLRDEAWHAALETAVATGLDGADAFDSADVFGTVDDLGLDVSERTVRKTLRVMVDFGYLERVDETANTPKGEHATYRLNAEVSER